jgi:hypothetical protein
MVTKVKSNYKYDTETGIRVGTVKIKNKSLKTPIKAIEPNKYLEKYPLNKNILGINEIYKSVRGIKAEESKKKIHTIEELRKDASKDSKFSNGLNNCFNAPNKNDITFCFMAFEDSRFPNKEELRFLTTRNYCYSSDIVPFPILSSIKNFVDINKINEYIEFLERCHTEIDLINDKSKMGIIPTQLGQIFIEEILDFYVNHDIISYFFDFGGSNITSKYPMIIDFYKSLKEYGIVDETFLYALNPGRGKAGHKKNIINSKDVVSFAYGFDVLGRYKPPVVIGTPPVNLSMRKLRVLNKEDYGYHNVIGEEIDKIYPKDSSIPLEDLKKIKINYTKSGYPYLDTQLINLFNIEQKGLEALRLPTFVKENSTKEYFSKKEFVDSKDKSNILEFRKKVNSKKEVQTRFS